MHKLVVQEDKIIAIGNDIPYITRLQAYKLSNGEVDTSWGSNGIQLYDFYPINYVFMSVIDLLVQEDGKFLISSDNLIFRFLPSGELDSTFANNGHLAPLFADMVSPGFDYTDYPLAPSLTLDIQNNNKILIAGMGVEYSQYDGLGIVERYLLDGSLDTTFANNGICVVDFNTTNNQKYKQAMGWVVTQNDGSFVVGGSVRDTSDSGGGKVMFALHKFTKDGFPEVNFGDDGVVITSPFIPSNPIDFVFTTIIQPDSKILMIGVNIETSSKTNKALLMSRYNNRDETTGVAENSVTNIDFKLFPNPASSQVNLVTPQKGTIEIYTTTGSCVLRQEIPKGNHVISLESLNRGIYYVKYITTSFQCIKKMIKY